MAARCFVVLAVCVPVLALAACGGSGGGGLTMAQYDAKVNRLCLRTADQFREIHLGITMGDWRHYATEIISIGGNFNRKLAALTPPSSIAGPAASYLAENKKVLHDDLAAIAAAKAGNAAKFHAALVKGNTDQSSTYSWAAGIGASACYA